MFTEKLMDWHVSKNNREMPWKGEKNPYRIWLSEIILQQTRVEQGWSYYTRFLQAYPTITDLAHAQESDVFRLWEGLGYYARCRNLIHTAKKISDDLHGEFPSNYHELLKLKGVGSYTAAAIASFAYDLPHAVVDGNVSRVLSRFFGITDPVDGPVVKKRIHTLANQLLDKNLPGAYNQAIMDFGATICKPAAPLCADCIMQPHCKAFSDDLVDDLPVKAKRPARKQRWFYYLHVEMDGMVLVRERTGKDIWRNLNELYLVETFERKSLHDLQKLPELLALTGGKPASSNNITKEQRQLLTHQEINGRFVQIEAAGQETPPGGYRWIAREDLDSIPFPKLIASYLSEIR
jgi:A/G-specific adenine glycosylase